MSDEIFPFVGDFRELQHGSPDGPSLRSAVCAQEPPHARELVRYLRGGAVLASTASITFDVLSSGNTVIGGLQLLTDGRWLWYSDLAHYVEHHRVALDPRFVAHAQGNGWSAPQLSRTDLLALESALLGGASED